ncbi:hypothetical protein CALVIDRAFT_594411 [Calocera viscosa TUFC12733]|uniref:Uncharacterized protein n=1 Tax=Calocera viscosa (strain TUFC12733) TaxID=1330018 RepID=A0A167S9X5_CALVF|nr:hypothetical protein CALVIDRAFT_594411 [Calocera viscosa TUFC12733]
MVRTNSPQIARTSPSHTPAKKRIRLARNVKYSWELPPSTVLKPEFPTFKGIFKHWCTLFERRDLDATEHTDDMTDYDYWPELDGRTVEYSIDEERRMRWNARKMREGAFERYRRITQKFTPQKRITNWVTEQAEVSSYDETVSPVKTVIRMSPAVRRALNDAAQQVAAKKAQAHYQAGLAKAKTDAKLRLDENTRPRGSPSRKRAQPMVVVDIAGPRTRSSNRKAPAPAAAQVKASVKTPAKPLAVKRKHVDEPEAAEDAPRPTKRSRQLKSLGTADILLAQLAIENATRAGKSPPLHALRVVEEARRRRQSPVVPMAVPAAAVSHAPVAVPLVEAAPAPVIAAVPLVEAAPAPVAVPAVEAVPVVPPRTATRHSARQNAKAAQVAAQKSSPSQVEPAPPIQQIRPKRARKVPEPYDRSTLPRGTARLLLAQLQASQATVDAERATASVAMVEAKAPYQPVTSVPKTDGRTNPTGASRYALRERTNTETRKQEDVTRNAIIEQERRCKGCKHLFSTRPALAKHKMGVRAKPACRA